MNNTDKKLLLLDHYKPHYDAEVVDAFEKNQTTILVIPPKMTKHLQPLDISIIKSFKSNFRHRVYKNNDNASQISRRELMILVKKSINRVKNSIVSIHFQFTNE